MSFTNTGDQRDIFGINTDGSNMANLTDNVSIDRGYEWSPDGTKILFDSNRYGDFELFVMNTDGSDQRQLTFNNWHDSKLSTRGWKLFLGGCILFIVRISDMNTELRGQG